jgi:sec-independent protein translocase protein TatA
MLHTLAWGFPQGPELLLILGIALLIFGNRLPEVGKSLGKGIVEFRKGLKGVEDDVEKSSQPRADAAGSVQPPFKFDPYTGKPVAPELPAGAKFDPYTGKPLEAAASQPRNA